MRERIKLNFCTEVELHFVLEEKMNVSMNE